MGKIYLGVNEKLRKRVEAVLTGRQIIPGGGAEDFVLDAIESKDPRCIELIVGYHLELGVDYTALITKARVRGLVNPTGWLLNQARSALIELCEDIPKDMNKSIHELEGIISKETYNLTPLAPEFFSRIDDDIAEQWNVVAPYTKDSIVRGVRWACQDKKKSREKI